MAKKLTYGTREVRLHDDADLPRLRGIIRSVTARGRTEWIEIPAPKGKFAILVAPSIPVMFEEDTPYEGEGVALPKDA